MGYTADCSIHMAIFANNMSTNRQSVQRNISGIQFQHVYLRFFITVHSFTASGKSKFGPVDSLFTGHDCFPALRLNFQRHMVYSEHCTLHMVQKSFRFTTTNFIFLYRIIMCVRNCFFDCQSPYFVYLYNVHTEFARMPKIIVDFIDFQ